MTASERGCLHFRVDAGVLSDENSKLPGVAGANTAADMYLIAPASIRSAPPSSAVVVPPHVSAGDREGTDNAGAGTANSFVFQR